MADTPEAAAREVAEQARRIWCNNYEDGYCTVACPCLSTYSACRVLPRIEAAIRALAGSTKEGE